MRKVYIFLFFSILISISCSKAQNNPDCNDSFATNYQSQATGNLDCLFPTLNNTLNFITDLDLGIDETSGLASVGGRLLTHNDSGGKSELYAFDHSTGRITHTFAVTGATNIDWEELAQNEEFVFIGDLGNNNGNRRNLKIYLVENSAFDFTQPTGEVPVSGVISFDYPEQESFEKGNKHNFDCEAMFYSEGYLYLFMKHRKDRYAVLYRLPSVPGTYRAEKLGGFRSEVKLTGADISPDGQKVYLVGYDKENQCMLWEFSEFSGSDFLSGKKEAYNLGAFSIWGQIEAVKILDDQSIFLTSEAVKSLPPRLYSFHK